MLGHKSYLFLSKTPILGQENRDFINGGSVGGGGGSGVGGVTIFKNLFSIMDGFPYTNFLLKAMLYVKIKGIGL